MNKTFIKVAIIPLITITAIMAVRVIFWWPEDTRLCTEGQRIRHGNPSAPVPTSWCILLSKSTIMPATLQIIADRVDNGYIPARYTCDAKSEFPPLTIHNIHADVRSLVLIVDDPDASGGTRDHYLLANIPFVGENVKITQATEKNAVVGKNSRGKTTRWAPCPPNGVHRYFFKIYALDQVLDIQVWFTKAELLEAMAGHIINQMELIGLYQRK